MPRVKKGAPKKQENKSQQADKLKEQGNQSIQNGNYDKAIQQYTEAIELDNTNHVYFNNRSLAYYIKQNYEQSLNDAIKSIEINPKYHKAYIRQALALLELDRLDEAIQLLKNAEQHVEKSEIQETQDQLDKEYQKWHVLADDDPEIVTHNKMMQWLKDGHSDYSKLRMQFYEKNYRGVHATQKIHNKEVILYIPKSHLITLEMAKETNVSKQILSNKVELLSPKHSYLSTILLQEKHKKNSKWKVYLDILPSNYDTFPIFFNNQDLEWLQGSPFLNQVRDKVNDMKKDYNDICEVSEDFKKYSFAEFCWARMTASSRIFGLNIEGQKTDAFVPLADMLNHKRPKQTSWCYSDERGGFVIESLEDIERGEQVFDSYGRKCNSRFLLNYGFIVENNDANEVSLRAEFDPTDVNLKIKQELMNDDSEYKQFRVLDNYEEQNNIEFLGYIRYTCHIDKQKLLLLNNIHEQQQQQESNNKNNNGYKPQKTPPVSVENENQMWEKVTRICIQQQNQYPTTLEEDQKLLQQNDLTINQKNCVLLRQGEKLILKELIQMAEKMKYLLTLSKKEIQNLMLKPDYTKYSNYISKVLTGTLKQNKN